VPKHQTIEKTEMPLVLGWSMQFQCFQESINLQNDAYKMYNAYNGKQSKNIFSSFSWVSFYHPRDSNTGQHSHERVCWPLGQD
jgi:hypothetical protein